MRKRQPAKSAAQGAGAEAPGKGRSQFRRESRARLNPREAGPEPEGKGPCPGRSALRVAGLQLTGQLT